MAEGRETVGDAGEGMASLCGQLGVVSPNVAPSWL